MESGLHKERGKMEFPSLETPAIIAMKGLPSTFKTILAIAIGRWASCPILRIDDILDNGDSSPSEDEAERLHRRAFDILCNVAAFHVGDYYKHKCVITKSRLCDTFELDRVMQLAVESHDDLPYPHPLLIIECQIRNEHRWRQHYDDIFSDSDQKRWYRPQKWNEVEMARRDYDAQGWDSHFDQTIKQLPDENRHLVKRLVLDVSNFLDFIKQDLAWEFSITHLFADAIKYLLTSNISELRELPHVVEFDHLRRLRLEKELNAPRERSKYLCSDERGCMFKYMEALEEDEAANCCGACGKQVSGPGYACYFCNLALHKSCAEMVNMSNVPYSDDDDDYHFPETYACNSCKEGGKSYSRECPSCIFQTHLKCHLMPTIVCHDCHPEHFLSIQLPPIPGFRDNDFFEKTVPVYMCNACGQEDFGNSYVCKLCKYHYHLRCVALPREVSNA